MADRFELVRPLGRGGMGEVYEAFDHSLKQKVAIKIFQKSTTSPLALERIRREVASSRNVQHPNLVQYHDFHEDPAYYILSMELVQGVTCKSYLQEHGSMSESQIRSFLSDIVPALQLLHERGIVHRDVKPGNLFYTDSGHFKLGDFGVVHVIDDATLTRTGDAMGTIQYMSPEALSGKEPGSPADYYALGITLYELISGKMPFNGTMGEIVKAHISSPPPVLPREYPSTLRALISGLLLKNPERRWSSREIEQFLNQKRMPWLPGKKRKVAVSLFVICMVLALSFLIPSLMIPNPSHLKVQKTVVSCYAGKTFLWKKNSSGTQNNVLFDMDQDGKREAFLSQVLKIPDSKEIEIPAWEANGNYSYSIPLNLSIFINNFDRFSNHYLLLFFPFSTDHLLFSVQHQLYFPGAFYLWSPQSHSIQFYAITSGHLHSAASWKDRAVFYGSNNGLLHQYGLLISGPLNSFTRSIFQSVDHLNQFQHQNILAYHLLGNYGKAEFHDDGSIKIVDSSGDEETLRDDCTFSHQKISSGRRTLEHLMNYKNIQDLILNGKFSDAENAASSEWEITSQEGLFGYSVLFASLQAEAQARSGRIDEAILTCLDSYSTYPRYGEDLPVKAGLFAYLSGDYPKALDIWSSSIGMLYMGRRSESYTYRIYAAILYDPKLAEELISGRDARLSKTEPWYEYAQFQKGWISLLEKKTSEAKELFQHALETPGMEEHVAGYFLASHFTGTYSDREFQDYLSRGGGFPLELEWVSHLCHGNHEQAHTVWREMVQDAYHNSGTALMVPLLRKVCTVNGRGSLVEDSR